MVVYAQIFLWRRVSFGVGSQTKAMVWKLPHSVPVTAFKACSDTGNVEFLCAACD